jgi:hypothetical protein
VSPRSARSPTRFLPPALTLALAVLGVRSSGGPAPTDSDDHSAHRGHASHDLNHPFEIKQVLGTPSEFVGTLAYDAAGRRLLLTSFGPPANTKGPSFLYDLDPSTGAVRARARLPLLGEFAAGALLGGLLYHVVPYQSTLYGIDVGSERFGAVVKSLRLPALNDLAHDDDVYRFPYIAFTGAAATPDGRLILYAADLGELMTVDPRTGECQRRVRTTKGLSAIATLPSSEGRHLLLGSFDPVDSSFRHESRRYMFRSAHGILPLETVRAEGNYGNPGQRTVAWVVLDPETGEVLSAASAESTRLHAGSLAVLDREGAVGARYGRVTAFTTGDEGVLKVSWTPP